MTQIPILGPAIGRLTQQLAELTTSYRNDTASLTAFAKEKEDIIEKEKEMRVMVEKAEEKRAWFSDFKDWIEGVANFFDVKVGASIACYPDHTDNLCFVVSTHSSRNLKMSMYRCYKSGLT
jgi:hypothetical protein